jgi:hypothetical protein
LLLVSEDSSGRYQSSSLSSARCTRQDRVCLRFWCPKPRRQRRQPCARCSDSFCGHGNSASDAAALTRYCPCRRASLRCRTRLPIPAARSRERACSAHLKREIAPRAPFQHSFRPLLQRTRVRILSLDITPPVDDSTSCSALLDHHHLLLAPITQGRCSPELAFQGGRSVGGSRGSRTCRRGERRAVVEKKVCQIAGSQASSVGGGEWCVSELQTERSRTSLP